jgi:hypothetical protein
VQKWPYGRHLEFFLIFFIKIKKLGAIWKVLDTIGQIEKNWNFGGGSQKLKLWRSN